MSNGIVTKYLISLIAKQVNDNGLVVWYDPDGAYAAARFPASSSVSHRPMNFEGFCMAGS